jgi:hypothetical protein
MYVFVQYIPGDFVIHFAGKKGEIKENMLRYYLEVARSDSST